MMCIDDSLRNSIAPIPIQREAWLMTEPICHSTLWHALFIISLVRRRKDGSAPRKQRFHQDQPSNSVLIWSHSLNWDIILSQTWRVEINLHGTSSSGFAKPRATGWARGVDSCCFCNDYRTCCLGSGECVFSSWIRTLQFEIANKHSRSGWFRANCPWSVNQPKRRSSHWVRA
jgi:hypothetical protein